MRGVQIDGLRHQPANELPLDALQAKDHLANDYRDQEVDGPQPNGRPATVRTISEMTALI